MGLLYLTHESGPISFREFSINCSRSSINTGKLLHPDEGSLDHVVPRSRGGVDSWENLVWSAKEVNQRKADRLPHPGRPEAAQRPERRRNCRHNSENATLAVNQLKDSFSASHALVDREIYSAR
jgi:hypothetical protein